MIEEMKIKYCEDMYENKHQDNNGKTYGRMTPEQVPEILNEWRETFKEA